MEPWSPLTLIGQENEEMVKETEEQQLVRQKKKRQHGDREAT